MLSWRISELICVFIEAKVKRSGRKIPKIIGHMQQVELPTEAEFFDEIQTIVLRVFLLVIHSHYTALPWGFCFFKLTQPLPVSVKEKGGKPDRKQYPPSLWFKKSIQKPQVLELSRLCPETSTKLTVLEVGFTKWHLFHADSHYPYRST